MPPFRRAAKVTIDEVAFGGDGVGRIDGKVCFVPGTIPGEEAEISIIEEHSGFARGTLKRILTPSPLRVDPPCIYYGKCGGCAYQHITYEAQLEIKTGQIRQVLSRIGHLHDVPVNAMLPSPKTFGFRNRLTLHCDHGRVGFYEKKGSRVIDVDKCLLGEEEVNERLREFRKNPPWNGHFTLRAEGGRSPFEQTNEGVAKLLLDWVLSEATQVLEKKFAVDAYCGSGFFTEPLSGLGFQEVVGIDWSVPSIERARAGALRPGIRYLCGDVASHLKLELERGPGLVLLDPPREGLAKSVSQTLVANPPAKVIYISCDPATFARDARLLTASGLNLQKVVPFDMFPQTAEIELGGVFERESSRQNS